MNKWLDKETAAQRGEKLDVLKLFTLSALFKQKYIND